MIVLYLSPYKPIDDPRSSQKWIDNLSLLADCKLVILSPPTNRPVSDYDYTSLVSLLTLPAQVHRLHIYKSIIRIVFQLKPQVIISNSPDLLPFIYTYKILFGANLILDLQENYQANLLWNAKRTGLSLWLARLGERIARSLYKHCSLITVAEPCLFHELAGTLGAGAILLSNASLEYLDPKKISQPITIYRDGYLLTGTLGRHYGSMEALNWCQSQKANLCIVGHCPDGTFRQELTLQSLAYQAAYSHVPAGVISPTPISHAEIASAIARAEILLLPYRLSPAVRDRLPVKIFEAAQAQTPVSFTDNPAWRRQCASLGLPYTPFPPAAPLRRPNPALANVRALAWADHAAMRSVRQLLSSLQKTA